MLLAAGGCKKKAPDATPVGAAGSAGSGSAAATPPADAGPTEAERVAAALKKAEEEAATEAARWTDDLAKRAVELRDKPYQDAKEALTAILASDIRLPGHKDRDPARHPLETLTVLASRRR